MVNAELSGIAQYQQAVASTRAFDAVVSPAGVANFVADITPYLGAAKSFYENSSVIFDSEASYGSKAFAVGNIAFDAVGGRLVKKAAGFLGAAGGSVRGVLGFSDETAEAAVRNAPNTKTYQTYSKRNPQSGEVYSGRTSGTGTPAQNVARRDANHHRKGEGFGPAQLDKSSTNAAAVRGREQQLINANGGAKSQGGTSGNKINGISDANLRLQKYLDQAFKEFGR